jgi:hypothetical protein
MGQFLASASAVPSGIATVGSTIYVYPMLMGISPKMSGPSKHIVIAYFGDMASGSSFTVTHYGASHTFLKSNSNLPASNYMCFKTA